MKDVNIIGIHYGHNATVALLKNGKITDCVSEERFNRIKNSVGFPTLAFDYIKNKAAGKIDYYVFSQEKPYGYLFNKKRGFKSFSYAEVVNYAKNEQKISLKTELFLRFAPKIFYGKKMKAMKSVEPKDKDIIEMKEYFSNLIKEHSEKILYADHHLSHAFSNLFFLSHPEEKTLLFTLDGEGDDLCATVNIYHNGSIETISKVHKAHSLGYLYREITAFLGMRPDEHEFKVMGLAPYAKKEHSDKLIPLFEKLLWLNTQDEFESDIPMPLSKYYLRQNFVYNRFDNISGALQDFTENITLEWIKRWLDRTGIYHVGLSGGVFMNVKMNQKIAELPKIKSVSIVPSAGDESTSIGACAFGYKHFSEKNGTDFKLKPIDNLYLGTEYNNDEIEKFLKENNCYQTFNISKPENINKKIAELLAENKVVARCTGRMEFGARALGNRSILSNPSSYENVRIINEMIKNRDFWMPFATSILDTDKERYLKNSAVNNGFYMHITFSTKDEAQNKLIAAIHPYDKTSRPQIVKKENNPDYYEIIEEFKKITDIGGILNTSFNLHGEPNVESPADAIHTLKDSGLKYLAMGPFLILKK
ncbi:MAG: carbamoyltransferase C-terminal domain-containing protein [Candidatus Paceibacterota bacterium]